MNHAKTIAAGLRALKLLGIELPVWWGIATAGDWSAYLALAGIVRNAGLPVCLHLHVRIPPAGLPPLRLVSRLADADPDLLFTDRSGRCHCDCLSFAVDDLPVLDGKTPVQAFSEFFLSFHSTFSDFIGSTITDISVSLGPDGELRYPSFPEAIGLQASENSNATINTCSPISNDVPRSRATHYGASLVPMMPRSTTSLWIPSTSSRRTAARGKLPMEISSSPGDGSSLSLSLSRPPSRFCIGQSDCSSGGGD